VAAGRASSLEKVKADTVKNPVEGHDHDVRGVGPGEAFDFEAARLECGRGFLAEGRREIGEIAFLLLRRQPRRTVEDRARAALVTLRRAMDWLEDSPEFEEAHRVLDLAGEYVHGTFGCELHWNGAEYLRSAARILSAARISAAGSTTASSALASLRAPTYSRSRSCPGRSIAMRVSTQFPCRQTRFASRSALARGLAERETVSVRIVRPEPVSKAAVGDRNPSEGLLGRVGWRGKWRLRIFEDDFAHGYRCAVMAAGESAERHAVGERAAPAHRYDVQVGAVVSSGQLDVACGCLYPGDDGCEKCWPNRRRVEFDQEGSKDELPERPVPSELSISWAHHRRQIAAEEDKPTSAVHDRLVSHEAFLQQRGEPGHEAWLLLPRKHAAPSDLQGHPNRLRACRLDHLLRYIANDTDVLVR
jgi:hypothetical protein